MRLVDKDLTWQELDDEIVILDLRSSQYLRLNATAAALWRSLVEGCERDDLVNHLVGSYEVDRPQAEQDVDAFLQDLGREGWLDRAS